MRGKGKSALWAIAALLALNAVLVVAQPGLAVPRSLWGYFFGPKMVRAEVVLKEGAALRDFRIDRGRVRSVAPGSVTFVELDRTVVTIPVAATAEVRLNGRRVALTALRRGMTATTIREGDGPATTVHATGRAAGRR